MQTNQTETDLVQEVCSQCGGWVNPDLVQRYPGMEVWEWSCITCGRTSYENRNRQDGPYPERKVG